MDGQTKVAVEAYVQKMRQKMEATLRGVAEAVNGAADGAWVNGSEMQVRDLFADLRTEAYQTAVQMRLDAAQAAFSPAGPSRRPAPGEQRPTAEKPVDGQRAHCVVADPLV